MNLKAIIPVREGSERVKEKVLLPFGDTTLLEWKIEQLKKVLDKENIVVSTNSEKLINIAKRHGVSIHVRENKYCIGNEIPFSEVIEHVVKGVDADHIAWVPCVTPLMSPIEYKRGFSSYFDGLNSSYDSLVSVNLIKEYLWTNEGPLNYSASEKHVVSQNLPDIYRITNGLYMAPKEVMLQKKYFIGNNPQKYVVSQIAGIDIDYYEDYEMAKSLLSMYIDNEHDNYIY